MEFTKQNKLKILNIVSSNLLRQRKRSKDRIGNCQYRGLNGTKCAVGWLIPDEEYDKSLEGYSVSDACIADACGFSIYDNEWIKFLENLQQIHDKVHPNRWAKKFKELRENIQNE